jgi:hypothetical protein
MVCKPSVERRSHYACARRVFPALGKPTASAYWTSRSASASSSSVEWGEADGAILRVWPAAEPIAVEFTEAEVVMVECAFERWAQQLGISQDELEERLAN